MDGTGERIRILREKNGMSQEKLAAGLGVARQTVCKWENGMFMPNSDSINLLSAFFGVTPDYFLKNGQPDTTGTTSAETAAAVALPLTQVSKSSTADKSSAKRKRVFIAIAVIAAIAFVVGLIFTIITGCLAFDPNLGDDSIGIHNVGITGFVLSMLLLIIGLTAETVAVIFLIRGKRLNKK